MILCCPFSAASASAMHSEIPVTPVHTCSDLSVQNKASIMLIYCAINAIITIRVFCLRAGPSLQAQEPRLQFC